LFNTVPHTIFSFSKVLAKRKFTEQFPDDPVAAVEAFAQFMGFFGQATNTLSFGLSLLGTSFVIRSLGLKTTLLLFPCCLLAAGAVVYLFPSLEVVFAVMLALKALSYALNNPCKELLYQPTSKSVKFKAKSWIDIFGQRGAKVRHTHTHLQRIKARIGDGGGVVMFRISCLSTLNHHLLLLFF
jgi:ATP:ADP antiporter, AAA family